MPTRFAYVLPLLMLVACGAPNTPRPSQVALPSDSNSLPTPAETSAANSSGLPVLYITFVSHNEENGRYLEDRAIYLRNRALLVDLVRALTSKGATYNWQSDWNFLKAVEANDTGDVVSSTGGLNVVQWMDGQPGMEIDPHAHEHTYNYADVAYLIDGLGVTPSRTVGGFLFSPPDNPQGWEQHKEGISGRQYPNYFWQADVLWGAATQNHLGADDPSSGIWRPLDKNHFTTDDPNGRLIYIGGCAGGSAGAPLLLEDIASGRAPADGFYTATVMINQGKLDQAAIKQAAEFIDSLSDEVAAGRVQWVTLSQMAQLWRTEYGSKAFRYGCRDN
jgi:hypothetical protein